MPVYFLMRSDIVKKTGTYSITTPVTLSTVMSAGKKMMIKSNSGVVDDKNINAYLNARVLLDEDHPITVDLTARKFNFKKGMTIQPEAGDEAYFCGKNLVDYKNSLYDFSDSSLSGDKYVMGDIIVSNDLVFPANVHPFDINLIDLEANALSRTKSQTITVPYTISSVSSVNKMFVNKVDGVESFGLSSAISKLDSNDNNYNLDELTLTGLTANLDWTNDKTDQSNSVSYLYDNLVVRSNYDWLNRNSIATVDQVIVGDTNINGLSSFNDVTLTSGIVNQGLDNSDGFTQFDFNSIVTDAARTGSINTFAAPKTFSKEVKAKEAHVEKLKDVVHYDDIHLSTYRGNMLENDNEADPGSPDYSQTISGTWTLSNGIKVNDRLNVKDAIDGVEVEDFVLKHVKTKLANKEIPKITFKKDVTVKGNVETSGTAFSSELDSFMTNRVSLSESGTISHKLVFTSGVTVTGVDTIINKLNDIPAETWVKSGVDVNTPQLITGKKEFTSSLVTINGDLVTDDINTSVHPNVDFSVKHANALKITENAVIAGPNLHFNKKTYVTGERLSGDLPPDFHDVLSGLVSDVGTFVKDLYKFYNDNILNIIPKLDKEAPVANKLNLGNIGYLEEVDVPEYLKLDSITGARKIVLTSALELEENVYSVNAKAVTGCSRKTSCSCESTIIASPLDNVKSPTVDVNDRTFTFTLEAGTFTVLSTMESYSAECERNPDPANLIVSGFIPDDNVIEIEKFNKLSPLNIGTTYPFENLADMVSIGYVKDVVMWEVNGIVHLLLLVFT